VTYVTKWEGNLTIRETLHLICSQILSPCATCLITCEMDEVPAACNDLSQCKPMCVCPDDTFWDDASKKCVAEDACAAPDTCDKALAPNYLGTGATAVDCDDNTPGESSIAARAHLHVATRMHALFSA
jgi:hypothetical protein